MASELEFHALVREIITRGGQSSYLQPPAIPQDGINFAPLVGFHVVKYAGTLSDFIQNSIAKTNQSMAEGTTQLLQFGPPWTHGEVYIPLFVAESIMTQIIQFEKDQYIALKSGVGQVAVRSGRPVTHFIGEMQAIPQQAHPTTSAAVDAANAAFVDDYVQQTYHKHGLVFFDVGLVTTAVQKLLGNGNYAWGPLRDDQLLKLLGSGNITHEYVHWGSFCNAVLIMKAELDQIWYACINHFKVDRVEL
jgi:hypothetical protein